MGNRGHRLKKDIRDNTEIIELIGELEEALMDWKVKWFRERQGMDLDRFKPLFDKAKEKYKKLLSC